MLGLWRDRVERLLIKAGWEVAARLTPRPTLELVHERESFDGRGGREIIRRCVGPAYIEPQWGYVITEAGSLIEESMAPNLEYHKGPWRVGVASPRGFLAARQGKVRVIQAPSVISLRHFWEWNYYHFYLDTLSKLQIFDELGLDPATPIVVGRYTMELPFASDVIHLGNLGKRNWLIQDEAYVRADEVYYCRVKTRYGTRVQFLIEQLGANGGNPSAQSRIFLTRGPGTLRRLLNADAVEAVLKEYGFEIVDTADLPMVEQLAVFERARYLVALHGAGMVNLLFRYGAPMSVLELHGNEFRSTDFERLCRDLDFSWDHYSGPAAPGIDPRAADFSIDPDGLRQKLNEMIA